MRISFNMGILALILSYTLSQFYRAFLAVLAPVLQTETGATPGDLALSSGLWFIAFALMQPPVGWALERFGPARTVSVLLGAGGASGAAVFALATAPWHLHLSMALLGIGCSPALMGSFYIIARNYPAAAFGALAGMIVGIGSLGNILGATPLVWVIEAITWRASLWALAALTLAVAVLVRVSVRDPAKLAADGPRGSFGELLRLPALWAILPLLTVNYAASAGIRGLWAAPYLEQVFGADTVVIGHATLIMGLAMVLGNFLVGPVERAMRSIRRTVIWFTSVAVLVLAALWQFPAASLPLSIAMLGLVGMSGAGYTLLMAHGRAFLPPHLAARGVTFLNMFSITGVGILQFASRPVYQGVSASLPPAGAFGTLFLFFMAPLALGLLLYLLTKEGSDA